MKEFGQILNVTCCFVRPSLIFQNGDLLFVTEEGGRVVDRFRIPTRHPITDNEWHNIVLKRNRNQVSVVI